jgi:outer membrane protein
MKLKHMIINNMNMYFSKIILTVILNLGLINLALAQEGQGPVRLSLEQAQEYALENNRNVQSAKIDVSIMAKRVQESIALGLPHINLAGNYQHQFEVPEFSFGAYLDPNALPSEGYLTKDDFLSAYKESPMIPLGVKNNTTFDLTLSQLIFSGEYIVGLQASKVVQQMTEKSLVKTEDMTRESVAGSYYMVLVLEESARVLQESLITMDKTYEESVKMNEQGFNEDTDVDQIKISKSNLERLIASIKAQEEVSSKLLKFQMGMDFGQEIELTDSIPGLIQSANMRYINKPVYNVSSSIDYQLLNDQVQVSSLQLKLAKSAWLPNLSGFYRHQEQTNQPTFNFIVKDIAGITLSFPILTSGERTARISQARFNLDKSTLNRSNAEQGLVLDFETALSSFETAYNNFVTNRENIVLSKKIYEKSIIKFKEGVSTSFELSQNQSQYLTAESNYYNSVLTLLNAKAKLDRILSAY